MQKVFSLFGGALRETGTILDKVGLKFQGNYAFKEQREWRFIIMIRKIWNEMKICDL